MQLCQLRYSNERIVKTQANPASADSDDLKHFTDFRRAVTKEMGYESNRIVRLLTYKRLKSKYRQEN